MKDFIHIDLFSGIGGFAIAVDEVWPGSEHIFCDNDKFCRQVLKKHWPNSKIYNDIRQITPDTKSQRWDNGIAENKRKTTPQEHSPFHEIGLRESPSDTRSKKQRGIPNGKRKEISPFGEVFILTGGFPCQPFSQAGKRRGTEDDRYLWPEMLRVIQLTHPKWIIAENVRGLLTQKGGLVFEQVCLDLEAAGYEVQPFIIPAVAVNAPHRRDRVWIVANCKSGKSGKQTESERREDISGGNIQNATNSADRRFQKYGTQSKTQTNISEQGLWEQNWLEVAAKFCGVDDGLPAKLDFAGWTKAGHRVQRLKALGNAIVPQVAIEIMRATRNQKKLF